MEKVKKNKIDLTEGPILIKIILFILPLMATNLLQVLYNAADMITVSLSKEGDAVGAIGTTGAFINLVVNVFIGFSVGANVIVARHIGEKDDEATSKTVHTSVTISLIFGFIGSIIGLVISKPVLSLMGNEGNLLKLSTTYTRIYFLGVPFLSLTNYLIAIFRAKGDTKTPLYVLTGTGLLNVLLNLFFVLVCSLSVEGVALATSISNAVSMVILIFILSKDPGPCRFSFKKLTLHKKSFGEIVYVGLPAGIQGALFSLSNMIIQSSIIKVNYIMCPEATDYQPVVKGNASAANLEGFAYTATNSVHQASVTFTSQNVGAKKYDRVKRIMLLCYIVTFCIAILSSGILLLLRTPLLALYGIKAGAEGSLESIALNTAVTRMLYMFIPYFTLAFMELGSGILRGLGKSLTSTIVSLIGSCAMRIFWIYLVFYKNPSLEAIYISYPISWTLTAAIHFVCSIIVIRRIIKSSSQQNNCIDKRLKTQPV